MRNEAHNPTPTQSIMKMQIAKMPIHSLVLTFLYLVAPCHGQNFFGTYTTSLDALDKRLPAATIDRGGLNLSGVRTNTGGTYYFDFSGGAPTNFYDWNNQTTWGDPAGFNSITNDRNWTLYLTVLGPKSLGGNLTSKRAQWWATNGVALDWTNYEHAISWVVTQLPPQVVSIEVENEPTCGWSTNPDTNNPSFLSVGALADYIRHTYNGIKAGDSNLLVLSPSFANGGPSKRANFNELANYTYSDGTHPFDYCDGIAQHIYDDIKDTNSAGVSWGNLASLYPTNFQEKRFGLWYEELESWYTNLLANTNVSPNLPICITEFGWNVFVGNSNSTSGYPDLTSAQQADHMAKGYAALAAMGATVILGFDMEGNINYGSNVLHQPILRSVNFKDKSLLDTNASLSIRPAWTSSSTATTWLRNVGVGAHSRKVVNGDYLHVIGFGYGSVVWSESTNTFAYNCGQTLSQALDLNGNALGITGGTTVTISNNPVFLTYADGNSVNLANNPGFEADASQTPSGWFTYAQNAADVDVDFSDAVSASPSHSGSNTLVHNSDTKAWTNVFTYQTLTSLPSGTYTLSAWVKATTNINAVLAVKEYQPGGQGYLTKTIPTTTNNVYTNIFLDVNVTGGSCTFGFKTLTNQAYAMLIVDDVKFTLKNLAVNPSFEANTSQTPSGWSTWTQYPADVNVDYTTNALSHSGNNKLVHARSTTWTNVFTYQVLSGLSNGTYTLNAWVKATSGVNAVLVAKEFLPGGLGYLTNTIPATGYYVPISLDVLATNGSCTIGVKSLTGAANSVLSVDDVSFRLRN